MAGTPLQECKRGFSIRMVLKHRRHWTTNVHFLVRISQEITDQSHIVSVWHLDENDNIRSLLLKRRMHRVPDPLIRSRYPIVFQA